MPIKTIVTRRKLLGFAAEADAGTPETVSGAMGAAVYDATMSPDDQFGNGERRPLGSMGTRLASRGAHAGTLSFRVEVEPSGVFLSLLQFCGYKLNSGGTLATPAADPSEQTTATFYLWEGGRLKQLAGAAGNVTLEGTDGERVFANFEFSGIYQTVADQDMPSEPDRNSIGFRLKSSTLTLGGSSVPAVGSININLNNTVEVRQTLANEAAIAHYLVSDRGPQMTLDPEARKVADFDVFGKHDSESLEAFSLAIPSGSDTLTISGPKAQIVGVDDGNRDNKLTDGLSLAFHADSGADELQFEITTT